MTKPSSKTEVEPSHVIPVTLDDFEGEDRKAMEEYINELTRPKLAPDVVSNDEVSQSINQQIASTIDSSMTNFKDRLDVMFKEKVDGFLRNRLGSLMDDYILKDKAYTTVDQSPIDPIGSNTDGAAFTAGPTGPNGRSDHDTAVGPTGQMAGPTGYYPVGPTGQMAGQTGYYPTGQTGPQAGPIAQHDAGLTGPARTFDPPVSAATTNPQIPPHIPNVYNDISRGYPPDTRQSQYNHIAPQTQPIRPPNPPQNPQGPNNMEDMISDIMRNRFGIKTRNRAKSYKKPYPDYYDNVPFPRNYRVPEFAKFSGEDAEPSDGLDCVTSLDNDGIAEPSGGSDCVDSLENSIIEDIAELDDGSDCTTSESEIALSPKIESQIGHVDVRKDDDNVLRDSGAIESKVVMHTYQRPYPEYVDSVPYPQGFEVPNFTKFIGENAMTTMEHIGRFIDQCGKDGSDDLLKLKLFPLSLQSFASTWYSLLAPNSISTWSQMEHEFHGYLKDASLMEQTPIDTSSVTCETISVSSMPKTGIVSDPLPVSPIDVDKKKGKSFIIGDLRPKNRIKNAKAEDHKVVKDGSSNSQKTKKPKLTFEMLMAKDKKGLAGQRFDNQTSDSKQPRSSRRKRFGQTSKQSEPSTIPTPYKLPFNRSGKSKVKNVKKVWVRKEAKAPEVVAINEESQDVHVPTGDAAKTMQAEKIEADAVTVNIGGPTETADRSNRQSTAGLTDPPGRSDRWLVASRTGPRD
uniref:Retrotransposon protein, putative, Ty3-gypsy subclass n=1 Tax=Oryza sativa subsp. japonica TaxID=39947 RepID=Q2QRV6_ORYSJ|nr:retrotransposon protein, putative, Ty3-gypsy subclass [Oryza sativa Japonica Group]